MDPYLLSYCMVGSYANVVLTINTPKNLISPIISLLARSNSKVEAVAYIEAN